METGEKVRCICDKYAFQLHCFLMFTQCHVSDNGLKLMLSTKLYHLNNSWLANVSLSGNEYFSNCLYDFGITFVY